MTSTPTASSAAVSPAYKWQNGNFVYGVEGDVNYNGMDGDNAGVESEVRVDGSLRGRLGYAVTPDVLLYGTAGGAAQSLKIRDAVGSDSNTMVGWTAGVGVDVKVTEQRLRPRRVSLHGLRQRRLQHRWR
jgi:outer membrane immunogenic protein